MVDILFTAYSMVPLICRSNLAGRYLEEGVLTTIPMVRCCDSKLAFLRMTITRRHHLNLLVSSKPLLLFRQQISDLIWIYRENIQRTVSSCQICLLGFWPPGLA
jgi:hypothetical protein